jgi:hypothetical protein
MKKLLLIVLSLVVLSSCLKYAEPPLLSLSGLYVIDKITTESVVDGIVNVMWNYDERRQDIFNKRKDYSWDEVGKILAKYYHNVLKVNEKYNSNRTRNLYIKAYD